MKIAKYILGIALSSIAALSAHADNNWSVGVVVGNPYAPPPVYYAPPPVYYAPPPVVIYRHPHSSYYGAPAVGYAPPAPGFIQFGYNNGGYRGFDRGPRGPRGGWGRGHDHDHRHHH
ncbi:MAG TPA: hypothetical protein VK958_12740 [Methylophilus sp.]|uniref:hypothetical protein n=1 Tax=Methylophilus sp. TaxID=29541 RepID=UPI002BB7D944|nr:hypothetical protein [Methylophilus sp.]HSH88103.1 hypothetical protein [Methylophilus sp.]